jgi:iron complex transport system substrate-binding protein
MKIVSLLPAATEIVAALGLADQLVGRSHECDFPEDIGDRPTLTRARVDSSRPSQELDSEVRRLVSLGLPLYMLDEARLAALAPDVVVTQAACEVCAIAYDQVQGALRRTAPSARIVSLSPSRLTHIFDNILETAAACGVPARGDDLVSFLRRRLDAVAAARPRRRPRIAVIEWLAPPMLAGHWTPEAIEAAGGEALGPGPGVPATDTTWEAIRESRPDALVVAPCGFDLGRTLAEAAPLEAELRRIAPRILFMDGNRYLNRPGPRIVDAIEILGTWLRGEELRPGSGVADALRDPLWAQSGGALSGGPA